MNAAPLRLNTSRPLLLELWDRVGLVLVLGIIVAIASFSIEGFFSGNNFVALLLSVMRFGILACTMLFCLASGDFDLSIGSTAALSGVVAALVMKSTHSVGLSVGAALAAGAAVGLVNGVLIAWVGINALITTLATMEIARGLVHFICHSTPVPVNYTAFRAIGAHSTYGIPNPVWIMLGCFIAFGLLLNFTTFGRNTLAIGGNAEAANLAGVAVRRTKSLIFTIQGMIAGLVGTIVASQTANAHPEAGKGWELSVISACVLGGVSLQGGIGSIQAVVVGVLIMGTVQNILDLQSINPDYQHIITGAVLLGAVILDRLKLKLASR